MSVCVMCMHAIAQALCVLEDLELRDHLWYRISVLEGSRTSGSSLILIQSPYSSQWFIRGHQHWSSSCSRFPRSSELVLTETLSVIDYRGGIFQLVLYNIKRPEVESTCTLHWRPFTICTSYYSAIGDVVKFFILNTDHSSTWISNLTNQPY